MILDERLIAEAEARFGTPRDFPLEAVLNEYELEMLSMSLRKLRTHDVTLFILDQGDLAVIRKPQFPLDVYRAPSGGIHPGESLEEGALRDGYEEAGLDLRLERYLLRVPATFRPQAQWPGAASLPEPVRDPFDPEVIHRWTHVFLARVVGDRTLDPKDTREIAEARWMTVGELQGPVRDALLATGRALFGYRVALTDATVAELERYGLLGKVLGGGFRFHVWNEPLSLIVTSSAGSELDMSPGKVRELVWYDS